MNVSDFIHILQESDTVISPKQTRELEGILEEYPYFQAARALHLKGLKNLDSYKYNNALKVTAAHTADREVLFDYITSEEFIQSSIANSILGISEKLEDKETVSEEILPSEETEVFLGETEEQSPLPQNLKDAEQILDPALFESKTPEEVIQPKIEEEDKDLELGKPLPFTKSEKHSFAEWLQLSRPEPIIREEGKEEEGFEKKKKFELLDKFIENKPKISPAKKSDAKVTIEQSVKIDKNQLMTETLAKVYLEQKKYKKAIQAFKILSLKYPEKSGFFADQIRKVKSLRKDKHE